MVKDQKNNKQTKSDKEIELDEKTPIPSETEEKTETPVIDVEKTEEYQQLNDKYQRQAAEFDNYKKRSDREYTRLIETAESSIILKLLEVVDDIDRALNHSTDDLKTFKQGTELIFNKLSEILEKSGLEEIKAVGENFDPVYHEAVMQKEADNSEDGVVLEEVQKGYYLNGRILRPAKVIVAKGKAEPSGDKNNNRSDN